MYGWSLGFVLAKLGKAISLHYTVHNGSVMFKQERDNVIQVCGVIFVFLFFCLFEVP